MIVHSLVAHTSCILPEHQQHLVKTLSDAGGVGRSVATKLGIDLTGAVRGLAVAPVSAVTFPARRHGSRSEELGAVAAKQLTDTLAMFEPHVLEARDVPADTTARKPPVCDTTAVGMMLIPACRLFLWPGAYWPTHMEHGATRGPAGSIDPWPSAGLALRSGCTCGPCGNTWDRQQHQYHWPCPRVLTLQGYSGAHI
jgi:hypothetical protein